MGKIKVSVVSYLNSKPFVYGLKHSPIINNIELDEDMPSITALKLIEGNVDVGLVPVAAIPKLNDYEIITDYCIGADGIISSVCLYSDVPLNEIETILLDYQSRTSVALVQILAKKHWHINPIWKEASANFENSVVGKTAAVIIGDRTFGLNERYKYAFDLAEEWKKMTNMPFVFACWMAKKDASSSFIQKFNQALAIGMEHKQEVISQIGDKEFEVDVADYLNEKIKYNLDENKRKALELFLKYKEEL